MRSKLTLIPIAVLVLGCDSTSPVPVADVSISVASMDIGIGGSRQLDATIIDASGNVVTDRQVTWTSTEGGVAAVSASGLVTASALGVTTVMAAVNGVSATALVRVPALQSAMDEQVGYWVERAIVELYNTYVTKASGVVTHISTGCPNGGSVVITGYTFNGPTAQDVNLIFRTEFCRVNLTTGELSLTGRVTLDGSWNLSDSFMSLVYSATNPVMISGTARLADGTPFSVNEECLLRITRSGTASGDYSLSGTICGRAFSR
jgi:uncharacterized protein YjdB